MNDFGGNECMVLIDDSRFFLPEEKPSYNYAPRLMETLVQYETSEFRAHTVIKDLILLASGQKLQARKKLARELGRLS